MDHATVGIGDIALYLPEPRMDLDRLISYRLRSLPNMERHFERALRTTGQRSIRFPRPWEDSATMAAAAAYTLFQRAQDKQRIENLRYLVSGTETGVDFSKPLSAYVQGMLVASGLAIPSRIASYQLQHACAGATAGILTTGAMLAISNSDKDFAVVTASDVARYEGKSTAEVTQGAGAAAVLLECSPRLLQLDLSSPGFYSNDVDDFFRPIGSITARVKGQYSMICYRDSLDGALRDFVAKNDTTVRDLLMSTDYFVLHAPFKNMPGIALEKMFEKHVGLSSDETRALLEERGLYRSLEPIADTGNTYTASVFIALASLLQDRYLVQGDSIVGKSVLISSYGSGNTMILLRGTIAAEAPAVIASWPEHLVDAGKEASKEEYEHWMQSGYLEASEDGVPESLPLTGDGRTADKRFFLRSIRKDGYREYTWAAPVIEEPVEKPSRDQLVESASARLSR